MKSDARYFVGALAALGCAVLLAGCGGGGGGGSDSSDGGTTATITLANNPDPEDVESEESIAAGDAGFFFGWRQVRSRDILSLTVAITEIYFQYCEGDGTGGLPEVVIVSDSEFDLPSITIKEGDTVRWEWATDTEHTITSGDPGDADAGALFNESASGTGSSVELTFEDKGMFPYFSSTEADIEAGMSGLVRVKKDHNDHGNDDRIQTAALSDAGPGPGGSFGERVMIFSGEFDVDLLSLTDLSQILTTTDIPAAEYCRIFIRIENPRLVLKADPDTVITNVHLTSFGRIVVREHFEIEEDEEILVLLDFGGIHVFRLGDLYVLFPRLKADVRVIGAELEVTGDIIAIDPALKSVDILTDVGDTFAVFLDRKTAIFTDEDADDATPTGAVLKLRFSDLETGQRVRALGTMDASAVVDAASLEVDDDEIDTTL